LEGVAVALVLCAALLHFGQPRDLGGRDVPPDARVREIPVRLGLADDHARALLGARLGERGAELARRRRAPGAGAEPFRAPREVELHVVAVQAAVAVADAELVPEVPADAKHLQSPDALVAVVLRDHDRDLQPVLERGHELAGIEDVRAVADVRVDLAPVLRDPNADRARHLVATARVTELEVATASAGGVPELEQVSGRRARGGDDGVARLHGLVQGEDQLGLRHRGVALVGEPRPLLEPGALRTFDFRAPWRALL